MKQNRTKPNNKTKPNHYTKPNTLLYRVLRLQWRRLLRESWLVLWRWLCRLLPCYKRNSVPTAQEIGRAIGVVCNAAPAALEGIAEWTARGLGPWAADHLDKPWDESCGTGCEWL